MKEERLNLKNRMFTSLKASNIRFPPYTPHYAMQHKPPQSYIALSAKPAPLWFKHLKHNPMDSKQAKHHCLQLICYRAMKKDMIHRFSTLLAHTTPIYNHVLFRGLSIERILPKAADHEKNATLRGTFACHTIFQGNDFIEEVDKEW